MKHPTMNIKHPTLLFHLALLVLVFAFLSMAYFFYLQLYPFKVVTLDIDPIPVKEKVIQAGKEQCIDMRFTKHHDFRADVEYYIEDGQLFILRTSGVFRPKGKAHVYRCFIIPPSLRAGVYPIKVGLLYRPTPFRIIPYTWESEKFTVIGGE